jgi:hypothetical protein
VVQQVGLAPTTLTLTSSPNPSINGQSVRFSAVLTLQMPGDTAPQPPTGVVTFSIDGQPVANIDVRPFGDPVSFSIASLRAGVHSVFASYTGDGDYAGSPANVTQFVYCAAGVGGNLGTGQTQTCF